MTNKIFAVYKPKGPTSHDIIDEIRKITGIKKVGHAGTLDPLARGVLVVGVGREATKKLNEIVKKEKEYIAVIKLGEESATDDEEGEKNSWLVDNLPANSFAMRRWQAGLVSLKDIEGIISKFVGTIMQTPPAYSAVKIKGKPAYRRTRRGEKIQLEPRMVEIKKIEILDYK